MKFTLQAYRELLKLIKQKKYQICNYHDYLREDKFVILRHDVDFDLKKAAKFAKLEMEMGVKSVYFILISSDFYNVLSSYNYNCIGEIISYGHEIGLHFDETKYAGMDMKQIKVAIYEEVKLLEAMIGQRIETVSMHRPSKEMLESDLELDYVINTYGKAFFKDIKYISDARMNWREDVIQILTREENKKIQLLTHPFWYSEEERTITDNLKKFVLRASEERYKELDGNLRDLESILSREDWYGTEH
ncbi:MAG: hypothetical protein KHY31_04250 [Clostridiales bacterium]|nr:hypothetical protein [Clostridiales bacterium]